MKTLRLSVGGSVSAGDPVIRQAAEIIRRGGLVAFPTETVYGLGANALDREALLRIFAAKQRPMWDPIIVHACSIEMARGLVKLWPTAAQRLAERFWPGPLTLLLPKLDLVPDACTAGLEKVGIRVPAHPVARALIEASGVPIAAPSANRFGATSPTTPEHVLRDLDGRIDAVLDAGPTMIGIESTVLDPATDPPIIYRPGGISREQLESVIGGVRIGAMQIENARSAERALCHDGPTESHESPGLAPRHYAPGAELLLVEDEREMAIVLEQRLVRGERVGLMLPEGWLRWQRTRECEVFAWGSFDQLETLASRLYAGLHWLDERGATVILCPMPAVAELGLAIRDRLSKAAK